MHGSAFEVGLMQAIYSLMQVFGSLILGALADVVGKRKVLLLSLFCSTISLIAFGLAENLFQLILFRGSNGFFAGTVSVCQAIVADVTTIEDRAGKMALIMAAYGVGVVVGPALAGFLACYGFTAVCFVAACCTFGNFAFAMWQLPEIKPEAESCDVSKKQLAEIGEEEMTTSSQMREIIRLMIVDPIIGPIFMINLLSNVGMGAFLGVTALLAHDIYSIDAAGVGRIYCAAGVAMVFFQGVVTKPVSEAIGEYYSVAVGAALRGASFALCAGWVADWVPWIGSIMVVASGALIDPCTASVVSKNTKENCSGVALGAFSALASLGSFLGPLASGWLYEIAPVLPFWICSGLMVACFMATFRAQIAHVQRSRRKASVQVALLPEDLGGESSSEDSMVARISSKQELMIRAGSYTNSFTLPIPLATMAKTNSIQRQGSRLSLASASSDNMVPLLSGENIEKTLARRLSLS